MSVDRFTGGLPAGAPAPGTSFTDLLRSLDLAQEWNGGKGDVEVRAPEGTTVLALRYSDGVVMVGDRQVAVAVEPGCVRQQQRTSRPPEFVDGDADVI